MDTIINGNNGPPELRHGSILIKEEIKEEMEKRKIIIEPPPRQFSDASVDLSLDNYFAKFVTTDEGVIDPAKEFHNIKYYERDFFLESYHIHPREFVLAQTFEYIVLPRNIVGYLDGRSSLGRRGIVIHSTAGYVDPGWNGHLVFEIANLGEMPFKLYPLMRVARLVFYRTKQLSGELESQFGHQLKIRKPGIDKEMERVNDFKDRLLSWQRPELNANANNQSEKPETH